MTGLVTRLLVAWDTLPPVRRYLLTFFGLLVVFLAIGAFRAFT